jgi:hypothetical protein
LAAPWSVVQQGRVVTASWQEEEGGKTFYGRFTGTLVTGDTVADDRVVGTYTIKSNGTVEKPLPMTLTLKSADEFDFTEHGATMERTTQGILSDRGLPSCSLTSKSPPAKPTTATKPTEPTTLTLTVNGWTVTATKAKPAAYVNHREDQPLASETALTIRATLDHPLPKGWKLIVYRTGDPLSPGNGVYYKVCEVDSPSTATSCKASRPGRIGPFDDTVFASLSAPTYLAMHSDIDIHFNAP